MYTFKESEKHNDQWRQSFCELAKGTFGIHFEEWYQHGFWNDDYASYCFMNGSEVIANVSFSTQKLLIEGKMRTGIQIGTVMTHPSYRRQGLARQLLQKVMNDQDADLFYLSANKEAIPLYEALGFHLTNTYDFMIDVAGYEVSKMQVENVNVSTEEAIELKRAARPLSSKLSVVDDEHVFMFYYFHGFDEAFYKLSSGIYVVAEIEGSKLHLYDVLSEDSWIIQEIVKDLVFPEIDTIVCHFSPEGWDEVKGMKVVENDTNHWMTFSEKDYTFPVKSTFPTITKA